MLCLLDGNNMAAFNLDSAKAVWEKLKSIYDPALCLQGDATPKKLDAKTVKHDIDSISEEINAIDEDAIPIEIIMGKDIVQTEIETKNQDTQNCENKIKLKKKLHGVAKKGDWSKVETILIKDKGLAAEAINSDGSTILHIAVAMSHNDIVKKMLSYLNDEQVLNKRNSDGSTGLHIAAIVGNTHAAKLLVKKNNKLLRIKDHKGQEPLHKACEYMHLDTTGYLIKVVNEDGKTELQSSSVGFVHPGVEIGADLLVNAISAKEYILASELVQKFPKVASKGDEVLMAIAKTFPSALNYEKTHIYPRIFSLLLIMAVFLVPSMFSSTFVSTLLVMVCYILVALLCFFSWVAPFRIEKEWYEAKKVLELVCDEIDKLDYSGTHHPYYTRPILEAACQNAYKVVEEILFRSPEAIHSRDKSGYDIIQLAIINRSENIYNLIYGIGERKNLYRTYKDSSENNLLHLAGKLAPSSVLNQRTSAALQLQRELQWREEVKKLVIPTYTSMENEYKETPYMVFTREHKNLVKDAEKWMRTTAESCSIIAALITTIVFASAITVPGGSDEKTGTPLFEKSFAFIVFAVSDAISLFASSSALLVFLSILTSRFAENDFLVSLPRQLFIGLYSLLLSTTSMMVAFSATLFLVFCHENDWMLIPICGLAFIPIGIFVTLQLPLMVDLLKSTHVRIFGKQREGVHIKFNSYIPLYW